VRAIAVATMAAAIRVVTVQRGEDPREAVMVGFGGAGPMFAVDLARVFGMGRVVVPAAAGVGSAAGLLHADLSVEELRTRVLAATEANFPAVAATFDELKAAALDVIGQDPATVEWRYGIDMRYHGQAHQLPVPLSEADLAEGPAPILAAFRAVYERAYGVAQQQAAEFVTYRVRAISPFASGAAAGNESPASEPGAVQAAGSRRATFTAEDGFVDVPVYARAQLRAGHRVLGPALVEGPESTTLVPPGALLTVDALGTMNLWPDGKDLA
jgi:N-methylhydantoinase A/oxoprolinase/acetone carboxylase beta subunit